MQKLKRKNEFVFRFSYFTFENEKRKTNSFFVFLTSLLKTKNEKGIRYPFFVRKFENEKGKNGIYTDHTKTHWKVDYVFAAGGRKITSVLTGLERLRRKR